MWKQDILNLCVFSSLQALPLALLYPMRLPLFFLQKLSNELFWTSLLCVNRTGTLSLEMPRMLTPLSVVNTLWSPWFFTLNVLFCKIDFSLKILEHTYIYFLNLEPAGAKKQSNIKLEETFRSLVLLKLNLFFCNDVLPKTRLSQAWLKTWFEPISNFSYQCTL